MKTETVQEPKKSHYQCDKCGMWFEITLYAGKGRFHLEPCDCGGEKILVNHIKSVIDHINSPFFIIHPKAH